MTHATVARIDRLYAAWIGYPPIEECGEHPRAVLAVLREYRAERRAHDVKI